MLGEKRNASILNPHPSSSKDTYTSESEAFQKQMNQEQMNPKQKEETSRKGEERVEVVDKAITSAKSHEKMELQFTSNTHNIFAGEQEVWSYTDVVQEVQTYISDNYSELIVGDIKESKSMMLRYIKKVLQEKKIIVEGYETSELIDLIYTEMAEYGFLTKYVFGTGIEEINVNAWNDIEVQYSDGHTEKLEEKFESPDHAINVIRRMLHVSGMVLDNSSPIVLGHLTKNIRIAAMKTPIVDEDVGVSASIRIVNPRSMGKEEFIKNGTATNRMLDFLSSCIRYGVSTCFSGATSSGKTTTLGWILTTIPNGKRIYTIENGSRELDLVRADKEGNVLNSVIHTLTRDSDNERQKVTQIDLLDTALRFNPDIAVVGEMRGAEANAGQEMARTGITVITTVHANSCESTYRRMVSLCKRAVDLSDETLMQYVTEAYPIVVFCKQLENKERKMMEIMECEIDAQGQRHYRTIFQYVIQENYIEDGKFVIVGEHQQVNPISESLGKRLLENGMSQTQIEEWKEVQ